MSCLTISIVFKFTYIPFNALIIMMSLATTALSAVLIADVSDYYQLTARLTTSEADVSIGIIILSMLTVCLGLTGCLVAVRQTFALTVLYSCLALAVASSVLGVGLYQILTQDQRNDEVGAAILQRMESYETDPYTWHDINMGQRQHACCGAHHYTDWLPTNLSTNAVPKSCCTWKSLYQEFTSCNLNATYQDFLLVPTIYTRGCQVAYQEDIGALPATLGSLTVLLGVLQLGGLVGLLSTLGKELYLNM